MAKNIFIIFFIVVIGAFFTNIFKTKTKNLEEKITEKKKSILKLKLSNESELKENIFLKSPERIKLLAKELLGNEYLFYKNKNIKQMHLDEKK